MSMPPSIPRHQFLLTVPVPTVKTDISTTGARWRTAEFRFYFLLIGVVLPWMFWVAYDTTSDVLPWKLKPGWIPGRKMDLSDAQYRSFRQNLPVLAVTATGHALLTRLTDKMNLNLVFSLLFIGVLHGTSFFKVMLVIGTSYSLRRSQVLTWTFNIVLLFAASYFGGFKYASMHPSLEWLDGYAGLYPRWHVSWNITMLRLISFNIDAPDASFVQLLDYALYAPLYIAGPIITYSDFASQRKIHPKVSLVSPLIRFLIPLLTIEVMLHFIYAWSYSAVGLAPLNSSLLSLFALFLVWLKLLVPWRFFRLWSMMPSPAIEPPENMIRCMANNYSPSAFWRGWHRSYNIWLKKYIYIPLGGNKHSLRNMLIVFTFVALWHDLEAHLLVWGWLASLFVVPELVFNPLIASMRSVTMQRHAYATLGAFNILLMMSANMIGFAGGLPALEVLCTLRGLRFLAGAMPCIFVAVQVMREYREEEQRRGVWRNC